MSVIVLAFAFQAPLATTGLFLVVAAAAVFGRRASLIYAIGSRAFAAANLTAPTEDRRLMRFNNSLAALFLGVAQIAFLARAPIVGWAFCFLTAAAAAIALAGFCFGCYLFFRFKLERYRLFGT